jgi:mycothiol synthase
VDLLARRAVREEAREAETERLMTTLTLRRVESEEDIDVFLALRRAIDPEHMPAPAQYREHVKTPGRVDLIAELDRAPVAAAFVERHGDNVDGPLAWVSVRVLAAQRRRGVGTALFRELSAIARADGKSELVFSSRHDDPDSLDYLGKRGFVEALRLRDSVLELADADTAFAPPPVVTVVPFAAELDEAVYEVALDAARDVPTPQESFEIGSFERWRADQLPNGTLRECSFVAVAGDAPVGYAILTAGLKGEGLHCMTGVRRAWRRRGIALALKQAQIDAAKAAGLRRLRTTNAVQNPMLRVNERLGYRRDVDWLHLRGPLLDGDAS